LAAKWAREPLRNRPSRIRPGQRGGASRSTHRLTEHLDISSELCPQNLLISAMADRGKTKAVDHDGRVR
jgi:hypothetical protein